MESKKRPLVYIFIFSSIKKALIVSQSGMGDIHDAARGGKLEEVKALLAAGVNIDAKDWVSKRMSS